MEQSVIIEFLYGFDSLEPLFALEDELRALVEKDGVGKVDGHEIAMDDSDGSIFLLSDDARKMVSVIEPVLYRYPFLKGAKLYITYGAGEDAHREEKIINPAGNLEQLGITDMRRLSPFPEWDENRLFRNSDQGEEWKTNGKNELAKKLYNQWQQVFLLLEGLCDSLKPPAPDEDEEMADMPVDDDYLEHLKEMFMGDGMVIPSKIVGAEAGDMYVLRMENAAIIRKAADDVYKQCSNFRMMGVSTDAELDAVRKEIDIFRQYFKEWVASFERDDWEDEWGLF